MERDQVVRGDCGARVVERPRLVRELERSQAEHLGDLETERAPLVGLRGDRGPGAVELFRPSRARERLQRVQRKPPRVRIQRGERRRPADVSDPARPEGLSLGHVPNGRVRDAEQGDLGVALDEQIALLEARGNCRADPAATDDVHASDHL